MTILEVCAIVAVIIFAMLAGFIIRTLLPLKRSLDGVENVLNPLVKTFTADNNVQKINDSQISEDNTKLEIVEWALLSIKLGEKLIKRR